MESMTMATTLKPGDRGELVKRLQVALISFGYDLGPAGADGSFGDGTKAAVASFQDARDLPATGVADPETIAAMDLDPDTLEDLIEIDGEQSTDESAATSVAVVEGDDVYLDPPVRLWPQYDNRWRNARIAGPKTGKMLDWIANGCNASVAAMTLRWFAEDCQAGKIDFPTKPGGSIDPSWYGLRMGESFWPNADPPGKVELTPEGRIHFRKLYSVAAHYLKTGEIERNEKGDVVDPSGPKAHYVTARPAGGWLDLIRNMLKTGPVIVGIGAPAGHFVLAHGVIAGALLVADPGGVLYQAHNGGAAEIANWKDKEGYLDGTMDSEKVRMPSPSQWPGGKAPGLEADARSYNHISGQYLSDLLDRLISVTSLTYPEGAKLG
jgi:Putative peptidoglycan binding domain